MKNTCQHFYRTAHFNASALLVSMQLCFTCTCKAVRHVHVEQYDMCMWSSETCTCKTTLHTGEPYVTLRDKVLSIPGKAEAVMTNAVIIR